MRLVRPAGGHTMGRAVGRNVGLAMTRAVVVQLPAGGTTCTASSVSAS